jgi:hypothetical protein
MSNTNNISKCERKKQFGDMMLELQEIADLSGKSLQLQTEVINLLKSDDPLARVKIKELENEHRILNEKINTLKNAFDEKYSQ